MDTRNVSLSELKAQLMQDPEFRAEYEALEPAYQVVRLRIARGLTQAELAKMVGTKQPNIARLESGKHPPNLSFLRRVVEALGADLRIQIMPRELAEDPAGR